MGKRSYQIDVLRIFKDGKQRAKDEIIHEEEVVVKLNGETHSFYCIPADLEEMIIGNLVSRGIDVSSLSLKKTGDTELEAIIPPTTTSPTRCDSRKTLTKNEIFHLVERLEENSFLYRKTGCTHVIGLCEGGREIFVEDISRHCALDKVIGRAIKQGMDLTNSALISSCRQTASTMRKAAYCRIPIVISIAAPTDLARAEAQEYGITLVGFASSERFTVYCHEWRIEV